MRGYGQEGTCDDLFVLCAINMAVVLCLLPAHSCGWEGNEVLRSSIGFGACGFASGSSVAFAQHVYSMVRRGPEIPGVGLKLTADLEKNKSWSFQPPETQRYRPTATPSRLSSFAPRKENRWFPQRAGGRLCGVTGVPYYCSSGAGYAPARPLDLHLCLFFCRREAILSALWLVVRGRY